MTVGDGGVDQTASSDLTERDRDMIGRLFSNPLFIPKVFKTWLINFLESADFTLSAAQLTIDPLTRSRLDGADAAAAAAASDAAVAAAAAAAVATVPVGAYLDYDGATDPSDPRFLIADGRSVLRSAYPAYFTLIGTRYGAADGTHFNIGNAQERVIVAYKSGSAEFGTLGGTGGEKTHALIAAEQASLPVTGTFSGTSDNPGNHTHPSIENEGSPAYMNGTDLTAFFDDVTGGGGAHTHAVSGSISGTATGGGGGHNNLQPYLTLNKLVRVL
jgi:microcystin-dependent protein